MPTKSWIEVPIDQEIWSVPEEGYAPFFFPPEGDYLLFHFTEESFLRVLSALINGAALTYPDTWLEVVWSFLKNVEYPVSLCEKITEALLTCTDVQEALATLISTNEGIQDALSDFVTSDQDIFNYINNTVSGLTGEQLGGAITSDCNNNVLAGQVITIVQRMHDYNLDALQIIEVGTNDEERIAALLEGVPIMGELPFGDILEAVQKLLEDFTENYSAAVTEAWKTSVEEDLYCLAKDKAGCELDYADLFAYFQQRVGSGLTVESLIQDVVTFLIAGDFNTDDLVASGMFALQLAFVRTGRQFFGLDLPKFTSLVRDAGTSTEWEEWDDCAETDCIDMTDWSALGGPTTGYGTKVGGTIAADLFVGDGKYYLDVIGPTEIAPDLSFITAGIAYFSRPVTGVQLGYASGAAISRYEGTPINAVRFDASNVFGSGSWPVDLTLGQLRINFRPTEPQDSAVSITQFCWET
jgi:hypothetical protein